MLQERLKKIQENEGMGTMSMIAYEQPFRIKKGEIFGVMTHADGRKEYFHEHMGQDECNQFVENLIVQRASILLATLMKGGLNVGISYFALGTGVGTGTTQNPQPPVANAIKLRNEIFRKPVTATFYDVNNTSGTTITDGMGRSNILEITATFGAGEATGALTEMALFGNSTATSAKDTGDMINMKTFPVWNKPSTATLSWTWRLTF